MKAALILIACALLAGCATRNELKQVMSNTSNQVVYLKLDRIRTGATDSVANYADSEVNENNPVAIYRAGMGDASRIAAEAKGKGFFQTLASFLPIVGAKAKELDDTVIILVGTNAIEQAARIVQSVYAPLASGSLMIETGNDLKETNDAETIRLAMGNVAKLAALQAELARVRSGSARSPEPTPEPPILDGVTDGIPGGNPNGASLGGGSEPGRPGDSTFLWKTSDTNPNEKTFLLPFPIRAESITVNGKRPKLRSLSNGWRETYFAPPGTGSPATVEGIDHDGKPFRFVVPDVNKRSGGANLARAGELTPRVGDNVGNGSGFDQPSDPRGVVYPGTPAQWGVSGNLVAIPAAYHKLSKQKRLSSREDSAILFESDHRVAFLIDLHQVVDGRHLWRLPSMRSGALKVLWDTAEPWRHEYARVDMSRDGAYSVPFRTVDRYGRNA